MRSLDDYLDLAKQNTGVKSDRELSKKFGGHQTIHQWRVRKALPSDEKMVLLAEMACIPEDEALAELGFWRSVSRNETHAAQVYRRMLQRLTQSAAALCLAFLVFFMLPVDPAHAGTMPQHQDTTSGQFINYAIN